jgi:small subunit ribosomal protein S8
MSMTDPVADLLTRIRNANSNGYKTVKVPFSSLKKEVLRVLKEQGYIVDYLPEMDGARGILRIELKYGPDGEKVIRSIDRVSKPGRRVYRSAPDLPRVLDGLGIAVVSTSRGVMSNLEAKKLRVGGEILCEVW